MKRGYTKKEAQRRRTKFIVLASMGDFIGTIAGFFTILACVVLLTTLITWLRGDVAKVFESLQAPIISAFEPNEVDEQQP